MRILELLSNLFNFHRRGAKEPMTHSEVERFIDRLALNYPVPLDPRNSVVDTMKALGMDSSFEAREALAKEFGYHGAADTAEMNLWLREEILKHVARGEPMS